MKEHIDTVKAMLQIDKFLEKQHTKDQLHLLCRAALEVCKECNLADKVFERWSYLKEHPGDYSKLKFPPCPKNI